MLSEVAVFPKFKELQHEVWICGPYSNSILPTAKLYSYKDDFYLNLLLQHILVFP